MIIKSETPPLSLTTDQQNFNFEVIFQFLSNDAYWSKDITRTELEEILKDNLCFGLFFEKEQIGLAILTTDFASFAYLSDVFVLEDYRGQGAGKWMLEQIVAQPELKALNLLLSTEDAQEFYEKFGFKVVGGSPDMMSTIQDLLS